jgi:hypothetical protein
MKNILLASIFIAVIFWGASVFAADQKKPVEVSDVSKNDLEVIKVLDVLEVIELVEFMDLINDMKLIVEVKDDEKSN